jgi:hypothetical protein
MTKFYLQFITLFICLFATSFSFAQTTETKVPTHGTIEGLTMYPNPVSNGKLYISSSKNLPKDIEIFDVLGKKIYTTSLFGKAMDISRLNIGVYIIKITENNITVTRKFVVR